MKTYFGSQFLDADFPPQTVVALGNFDGVHLGHQAILGRALEDSRTLGFPVVAFTFKPHPTLELKPESDLRLLMTYDEKRIRLQGLGVDCCIEEPFNATFAALSAKEFFDRILVGRAHARVIVVGENFTFGRNREGTIPVLKQFCDATGVTLRALPPVEVDGLPVSSSRIRAALSEGRVNLASELLGRPFFYKAEVVHGDKRGRTIGFPTANMKCDTKFALRSGVYATTVFWQGKTYPAVTNLGTRPTFDSSELRMETHLLHEDLELYGEILEVSFHDRIRDERKFASLDELKHQIRADTELAGHLLSSRNS
jgi:riboflavin kinase/FMN adenylyltransferase